MNKKRKRRNNDTRHQGQGQEQGQNKDQGQVKPQTPEPERPKTEEKAAQSTRRATNNPLDGIVIRSAQLQAKLKELLSKKYAPDVMKSVFADLKRDYKDEIVSINEVEKKLLPDEELVKASTDDIEIIDIEDCDGCLSTQRNQTIKNLRNLGSPAELEAFMTRLQYDTPPKMLGFVKHIMDYLGQEMKSRTKDAALNEFFRCLKGDRGDVTSFTKRESTFAS